MQLFDQEISHRAVRIVDDNLFGTGFERPEDSGVDLLRHEPPEAGIIRLVGPDLIPICDARRALHVRRDKDLHESSRWHRRVDTGLSNPPSRGGLDQGAE